MTRLISLLGGVVSFIVIVFGLGFLTGSICITYALNTWLLFLGKTNIILWWQGGLIGMIPGVGYVSIFVAIATWIFMLFH